MDKQCLICQKTFSAKRSTAKFCSAACKLKFNRDIKDDPPVIKKIILKKSTLCSVCNYGGYDPTDEWSHSACHKTQEEIEAHYTLKNFPRVKYGPGAGAYSPYPKANPLSKAYLLD